MNTPGKMEAAICQGIRCFEMETRGRAPKEIHAHLIGTLLVVRLQGVLTAAEQQMAKSPPHGAGRDLLKQVRTHLVETAKPELQFPYTGISKENIHMLADTKQKTLCVLVVDDNQDQARSLSMLLENSGYDSHTCHNSQDCMDLVDRLGPDVVLLDLGMPGVTGYEIAEVIKREDGLRHIRLFAVTGHGLPLDRLQTKLIGFDQHFIKPVDFEDLEYCLKSIQDQKSMNS